MHPSPKHTVSLPLDVTCQLEKRESGERERDKERKKEGGREQVTGTDKRTNALLGSVQGNRAMGTERNNILTKEK